MGPVSDKHGQRFHQDVAASEKRFQGGWESSMLADYYWNLLKYTHESQYKREVRNSKKTMPFH